METIGARVRRLREAKEWTQEQLVAASGIKQSTIQGIEDGSRSKRPSSLIEIAHALGVDAYYLKYGTEVLIAGDSKINEVVKLMQATDATGKAIVLDKARDTAKEYPASKAKCA